MASSSIALSKQLKRELAQQVWLRKNLTRTKQQQLPQRKVFVLRAQLAL
jgi:retron-type reverse transcriptase